MDNERIKQAFCQFLEESGIVPDSEAHVDQMERAFARAVRSANNNHLLLG